MKFYVLKPPQATSRHDRNAGVEFIQAEGFRVGEATKCNGCGQYTSLLSWLPPYRVELETWGRQYGDAGFGPTSDFLISARLQDIYESHRLRGLAGFEQVEVVRVKKRKACLGDPPPYLRANVSLSVTAIDQLSSGFEWEKQPACSMCRLGKVLKRWERICIEADTWTGEDIFIARGLPGTILTSNRFKEACETNGVKNVVFMPAETYGHDFYPWEKASADHS